MKVFYSNHGQVNAPNEPDEIGDLLPENADLDEDLDTFEESEFEDEDTELVDQDEAVTDHEDDQEFENAFGEVAPDENMNFGFDERVEDEDLIRLRNEFAPQINRVRKVCKFFRQSPKRNDRLQHYVREQFNRELKLQLDVKTRWASLYYMIARFLKLFAAIKKAMIDLTQREMKNGKVTRDYEKEFLDEIDLDQLNEIVEVMSVVIDGIKKLSQRDFDLVKANYLIEWMIQRLSDMGTDLANRMISSIRENMISRVGIQSKILDYLRTRSVPSGLTLTKIKKFVKEFVARSPITNRRADCEPEQIGRRRSNSDSADDEQEASERRKRQRLGGDSAGTSSDNDFIEFIKSREREDRELLSSKTCKIEKEIDSFNSGGELSSNLRFVKQCLEKIRPTSVECERLFSLVSLFTTKLRTRLDDDILNILVILKSHFKCIEERKKRDKAEADRKRKEEMRKALPLV